MELPIGMLIFWAHRFEDDHAVISGLWYYKEMYVPSTIKEKMLSISDLKSKRCTALNISGTYEQILDLLAQGDKFLNSDYSFEIEKFNKFKDDLFNLPKLKAYIFDDVYHLKGTSLMIDTIVEIEETMENISKQIMNGKTVNVNISESWSFADDLTKGLS